MSIKPVGGSAEAMTGPVSRSQLDHNQRAAAEIRRAWTWSESDTKEHHATAIRRKNPRVPNWVIGETVIPTLTVLQTYRYISFCSLILL